MAEIKSDGKRLLLTGASGFIGNHLLKELVNRGYHITAPVRSIFEHNQSQVKVPLIKDICSLADHHEYFSNCDVVIHVAGLAHLRGIQLTEFRRLNTEATLAIARRAAEFGARRFVFLSSIGVNGSSNTKPFTVEDQPCPQEDYALSKLEAEIGLRKIAIETDMEVVIIRPPLVYGPDAPGNFGKLVKLAAKNWPLPFGAINNNRSFVSVVNLVDLIITCINHPAAANETFLAGDDQDVSTAELLKLLTVAAGNQPRLLPVPVSWLKLLGKITGKTEEVARICSSLQVDISHTKNCLGWQPKITFKDAIAACINSNKPNI